MSIHSRGPWFVEKETGRVVMKRDDLIIPVCATRDYVNAVGNLPLLAAAPELYEYCELALEYLESAKPDDMLGKTLIDHLRAYLARLQQSTPSAR